MYQRPEGKSGGHGVGWSEIPRYKFKAGPQNPVAMRAQFGSSVHAIALASRFRHCACFCCDLKMLSTSSCKLAVQPCVPLSSARSRGSPEACTVMSGLCAVPVCL